MLLAQKLITAVKTTGTTGGPPPLSYQSYDITNESFNNVENDQSIDIGTQSGTKYVLMLQVSEINESTAPTTNDITIDVGGTALTTLYVDTAISNFMAVVAGGYITSLSGAQTITTTISTGTNTDFGGDVGTFCWVIDGEGFSISANSDYVSSNISNCEVQTTTDYPIVAIVFSDNSDSVFDWVGGDLIAIDTNVSPLIEYYSSASNSAAPSTGTTKVEVQNLTSSNEYLVVAAANPT